MKFSTKFLSLFAISSTFALSIPLENIENNKIAFNIENYDYSNLGINPIFPIKKECEEAIEKSILADAFDSKCFFDDDLFDSFGKVEERCKIFNSKKCKDIYKFKVSQIPECKNSELISLKSIDFMLEIAYLSMKNICTMDENGKICPLYDSKFIGSLDTNIEEGEQLQKVLNETCKSKKCTQNYLKLIDDLEKAQEEYLKILDKYELDDDFVKSVTNKVKRKVNESSIVNDEYLSEIINYFNSEECSSKAGEKPSKVDEPAKIEKPKTKKCIVKNKKN